MPLNDKAALEKQLLDAHRRGDRAQLITLYTAAADASDGEAADFYLTHAYVFALEAGDERAKELHARLKSRGREE